MADNCDLLLRAAELLDHTKQTNIDNDFSYAPSFSSPQGDDCAVPDISADESQYCEFMDSGDDNNSLASEEQFSKRPRMASLKGARLAARDAVAHNSVEKSRRAYLASCYENLKRVVPALAGTRASNVKVLRGGLALIKALEAEDRRLTAEKKKAIALRETLIRQNNTLAKQLVLRGKSEMTVPMAMPLTHPCASQLLPTDREEIAMSLMQLAEMCPAS